MLNYSFGNIDNYILFGGGELGGGETFTRLIEYLNNKNIVLFTSEKFMNSSSHISNLSYKEFLEKYNVEYYISENINTDNRLSKFVNSNSMGISINAPWIFKKNIIELFQGKLINEHGMRLPQNRGGGSFSWVIMQGNKNFYCAYHLVNEKIDDGAFIKFKEYEYNLSLRTPADYFNIQKLKHYDMLKEIIDEINEKKEFILSGQSSHLSSYYPKLNTEVHGYINWEWSVDEIVRFINAFSDPYSGAKTFSNGKLIRIKNAYSENNDGNFHPFQYGLIYRKYDNRLYVAGKNGTLVITELYSDDNKILLGDRLFTSCEVLDNAMNSRITYSTKGELINK